MYKYNDGLEPGSRRPRLYLAKGPAARKFEGANIGGWCVIAGRKFQRNGRWSNTTFELTLAPGVRPLALLSPLHGKWGDSLHSWGEVVEQLGVPLEVAQAIVRAEYRSTAERLDAVEQFAASVESTGAVVEVVVVAFGAPTRRAIEAGFWDAPKSGRTSDGETVTVGAPWDAPVVIAPIGARIISSRQSPGMHGGYWAIEIAVPIPNTARAADEGGDS